MSQLCLILGDGLAAKDTVAKITQKYPHLASLQVVYDSEDSDMICGVTQGKELFQVKQRVGGAEVVAVVNRFDSSIPLYGMLVDEYSIPGSGYEAVMNFKDKSRFHKLMTKAGLLKYRPKTEICMLDGLVKVLQQSELPVVVKPFTGAKSRGVYVITSIEEVPIAISRLKKHFSVERFAQGLREVHKVLVEEYIDGEQITVASYVDGRGKLEVVSFEGVLTGKDVGQKHKQLVYRTTPACISKNVEKEIVELLKALIEVSGLRSVCIHPEFVVVGDSIFVMEINVRIGGFRQKMLEYASGIDLGQIAIKLALGEEVTETKTKSESCTAVEWWGEESGRVRLLRLAKDKGIRDLRFKTRVGDDYVAPPEAQIPLAEFYVVDEKDSLSVAKQVLEQSSYSVERALLINS